MKSLLKGKDIPNNKQFHRLRIEMLFQDSLAPLIGVIYAMSTIAYLIHGVTEKKTELYVWATVFLGVSIFRIFYSLRFQKKLKRKQNTKLFKLGKRLCLISDHNCFAHVLLGISILARSR